MSWVRSLILILILISATIFLFAPGQASTGMTSDNYCIPWSVIANGGGAMASSSYQIQGIVTQTLVGKSQSNHFGLESGYWPGVLNWSRQEFQLFLPLIKQGN